jgi:hypothetical protein
MKLVESKFATLGLLLNISCISFVFICLVSFSSKNGPSPIMRLLNISNTTVGYILAGIPLSIIGVVIAYFIERKYKVIGALEYDSEFDCFRITNSLNSIVIQLQEIKRIYFFKGACKGEIDFYSLSASGTKNYVTITTDTSKFEFEVLLDSLVVESALKDVISYHMQLYRR